LKLARQKCEILSEKNKKPRGVKIKESSGGGELML
jgi:hypothetical protein